MISLTHALDHAARDAKANGQVLSSAHLTWILLADWRLENPHPNLGKAQDAIGLGLPFLECTNLARASGSKFFEPPEVCALFTQAGKDRHALEWMHAWLRPGSPAREVIEDSMLLDKLVIQHLRAHRLWGPDGPKAPPGAGRRIDSGTGWSAQELEPMVGREEVLESLHLNLQQAVSAGQPFLLAAARGAGSRLFLRHLLGKAVDDPARRLRFLYLDRADYGQTPEGLGQTLQNLLRTLDDDADLVPVLDDFGFLARVPGLLPVAQKELGGLVMGGDRCVVIRCHEANLGTWKSFLAELAPHFLNSLPPDAARRIVEQHWSRKHPKASGRETLDRLFEMLDRHFSADALPGRALDLLDRAAIVARARNPRRPPPPTPEDVTRCVSILLKLNPELAGKKPADFYPHLARRLRTRVFGQDHAVDCICHELYANAIRPPRSLPRGRFLFVGPPGTGKTRLAHCLAEELGYDREAFHVFNMGEFTGEGARNRFLGSDPGYRDFGGTFTIFKALQRTPACVILLDEIDRAHASIQDVLLGMLEGRGRDAYGVAYNLQQVVFIMTTNQQQALVENLWNTASRRLRKGPKEKPVAPAALAELRQEVCRQLEERNDLRKGLVQFTGSVAEGGMKDAVQDQLDTLGAKFLEARRAGGKGGAAEEVLLQRFIAARLRLAALTTQHQKSALDRALLDRIDYIVPFLPLHPLHLQQIVGNELSEEGWEDCPTPIRNRIIDDVAADSVGGRDVRRIIRQAFRDEHPLG